MRKIFFVCVVQNHNIMHLLVDQYQSLSQHLSAEISAAPKSLSGTELRLMVSRKADFFQLKGLQSTASN